MLAKDCNCIPNRISGNTAYRFGYEFVKSKSSLSADNGYYELILNILPECIIWGLGTAIGELPPYFMAKLGSIEENESSSPTFKSFGRIIKGNFGFFFVMVMAGIPNPLFDLAGLACG